MSEPATTFWQTYGTLAEMAQAAAALLGFLAILFQIDEIRSNNRAASARQAFPETQQWAMKTAAVAPPECKLRKT